MRALQQRLARTALAASIVLSSLAFVPPAPASAAGTQAGTQITNAATAQYSDGSGNTFTAQSNTVTTTVQNVPIVSHTVTNPGTIFPNQTVTDQFAFTNSGNNTGTFSIPSSTPITSSFSGGAAFTSVTLNAYAPGGTLMTSVGGEPQGTSCSGSGAALQTCINGFLTAYPIAPNGSVQFNVVYTSGTTVVNPGSSAADSNTLAPTLSYAAVGAASAQTASDTATATDTARSDALLDLAKSMSQPTNATTPFTATITFNDRGYGDAQAASLSSLGTGLPASGILIADKIPQVAGTPLALNSVPTFTGSPANGYNAASYQIFYTQATTLGASTAWTSINNNGSLGTLPSSGGPITYVILVLTPTSGQSILYGSNNAAHGTSTGPGNVSTPQGTLTVVLKQPGGQVTGIANTANSIIGTNGPGNAGPAPYAPGTVPTGGPPNILGPGPACYTDTDTTANVDAILNYTTGGTCTDGTFTSTPVNGIGGAVLLGPFSNAAATGAFSYGSGAAQNYDAGSGSNTNNGDFTAIVGYTGQSSDNATFVTTAAQTFAIPNTIQNNGNASDTFTLTGTDITGGPEAGITVSFNTAATCAAGTQITTTPAIAQSGSATIYACVAVASGTTLTLNAPIGFAVKAQSVNDPSTTASNTTYDVVYPGGFVAIAKTAAISGTPTLGTGSCSTATPLPGCTISYTVNYRNLLPVTASTTGIDVMGVLGTGSVTQGIAAFALVEDGVNGVNSNASSTGTANRNNWGCISTAVCSAAGQLTSGLIAVPTGDAKCTFSYLQNGGALTVTGTSSNGNTTAPSAGTPATAFACVYGSGTYLLPSTTASALTFSVQIH